MNLGIFRNRTIIAALIGVVLMAAVLATSGVATLVWAQAAGPRVEPVQQLPGKPDLSILKLGVVSGQTVTYTVTVTNIGQGPSSSPITVTDTLFTAPSGSTFASASGSGWSCTGPSNRSVAGSSGPVTCTYNGILGAGAPALTLTVVVNVPQGGNIENCASVAQGRTAATVDESSLLNNQSCRVLSVTAPAAGRPDLSITKTGVVSGNTVTYTITVTNIGNAPAAGPITVTDTLAPGSSGGVFSSMAGICSGGTSGPITCTSSTPLSPGAIMTFTIVVTAPLGGSIENCATVDQGKTGAIVVDPTPDNNRTCVETTVRPPATGRPDLAITKVGVVSGQTITYTITVKNIGTGPSASNNFVIDRLNAAPSGTTFVSASGSGWSCEGPNGPVAGAEGVAGCASYSSLAPGETATLTFTINVPQGGVVSNCAGIISVPSFTVQQPSFDGSVPSTDWTALSDSNVSNNEACMDITVPSTTTGRPDLKITKTGVVSGQTVTYTITVTNIGNATAASPITVTDTLATGTSSALFSSYSNDCSGGASGPITCTSNSPLASQGTLTFTIVVTTPLGGSIVNCATVDQGKTATSVADPNLGNNKACATANVLLVASPDTTTITYAYSVKFVCGTAKPLDPVAPGTYYTAINIHNYTDSAVTMSAKPVISYPIGNLSTISAKPVQTELKGGEARLIGCGDVLKSLKSSDPSLDETAFVDGFFDVFTEVSYANSFFDVFTELSLDGGALAPLEVNAVHSMGRFMGTELVGTSMNVLQVQPKVMLRESPSKASRVLPFDAGDGDNTFMLRESPTKASLGR